MKIVVVSNEYVGRAMTSVGIRSYHLAEELARAGLDVTLMIPNAAELAPEGVEVVRRPETWRRLRDELDRFDGVVAQTLPLAIMRRLAHGEQLVVYDLYVPVLAETLAGETNATPLSRLYGRAGVLEQQVALATGTAFICASERQRDFWLGALAAIGRLGGDTGPSHAALDLVEVVPFGVPTAEPAAEPGQLRSMFPGIERRNRVLLWAGGLVDWFDPLTVVRAVERLSARRDDVKLAFLGSVPPRGPETAVARAARRYASERGLLDRLVFFNEQWISYTERHKYLLDADLGVTAHRDTLEARLAFRTRILDHFWAGLPTVTTRGDVLAELIETKGLGRAVDAGDDTAFAAAVDDLLEDEANARVREHTREVRRMFAWPRVVEPLVRLLDRPPRVAPVGTPRAAVEHRLLELRIAAALRRGLGLR